MRELFYILDCTTTDVPDEFGITKYDDFLEAFFLGHHADEFIRGKRVGVTKEKFRNVLFIPKKADSLFVNSYKVPDVTLRLPEVEEVIPDDDPDSLIHIGDPVDKTGDIHFTEIIDGQNLYGLGLFGQAGQKVIDTWGHGLEENCNDYARKLAEKFAWEISSHYRRMMDKKHDELFMKINGG